ncbi:MAG: hypothetical protein P4L40_14785 [Terracidiphilus sp.]|nr:hypothetical protein [Terracidiphilus sp.]
MPAARRFPPRWTLDEANDACFIVREMPVVCRAIGRVVSPHPCLAGDNKAEGYRGAATAVRDYFLV